MLLEMAQVLGEGARILDLELHALRTEAVGLDEVRHALALDQLGVLLRVGLELLVLRRVRAVAAARHDDRERAMP